MNQEELREEISATRTMTNKEFIKYWLECTKSFQDFKQGEYYWLEALPNNQYNVRSDNLLGNTYIISDDELYSNFKQTNDKV